MTQDVYLEVLDDLVSNYNQALLIGQGVEEAKDRIFEWQGINFIISNDIPKKQKSGFKWR